MGFFFQNYTVESIIMLFGLIALLVVLNELTRKNKWVALVFFVACPIIIVALIIADVINTPSAATWFGVVKTYSALAGVLGFMLIRYFDKIGKSKFAFYFPVAILGINILEAMYHEIEIFVKYQTPITDSAGLYMQGGAWNIINTVAGLFLLLSMTGFMGIKVAKTKSRDMVWADQLWFWIIAYDLWNISYCYNSIANRAMYAGVAIIVACTLCELFCQRGAWLQHRAHTLALFGMFSLAFDYSSFGSFSITSSYDPNALLTVSILSLIANVAVFAYELYIIIKKKRNPLKEEMFTHLRAYRRNLDCNGLLVPKFDDEELVLVKNND